MIAGRPSAGYAVDGLGALVCCQQASVPFQRVYFFLAPLRLGRP